MVKRDVAAARISSPFATTRRAAEPAARSPSPAAWRRRSRGLPGSVGQRWEDM